MTASVMISHSNAKPNHAGTGKTDAGTNTDNTEANRHKQRAIWIMTRINIMYDLLMYHVRFYDLGCR